MMQSDVVSNAYFLFETGTGLCVLPSEAVHHHIENATVLGMPTAGPRFDSAVVQSPRQIVPAVDLRAREHGHHDADHGPDVLVLRETRSVGLIVDRVVGLISLAPGQIHALNQAQREQLPEYVSAVTFIDAQPVAVFDPRRLCAEDELLDRAVVSRRLDRRKTPRGPQPPGPTAVRA